MKNQRQRFIVIVVVSMIAFAMWILGISSNQPASSLAYPPPMQQAGASGGYPGPATSTPWPTSSWQGPGPSPTPTRWPRATPHSFPTSDTFRQGVASAWGGTGLPDRHNIGSWGIHYVPNVPAPYPSNVDHVPMLIGNINNTFPSVTLIQNSDTLTPHDYWLVFNECENNGQCNTPPEVAADFYHDVVLDTIFDPPIGTYGADPDADLIIGGVNASPCGILWLTQFMEYYRDTYGPNLYNAGWHFHVYPEVVPQTWPDPDDPEGGCNTWDAPPPGQGWWGREKRLNFESWHSDALAMLTFVWKWGEPDDEIWITEMGCLIDACDEWDGFKYEYVSAFMGWLNDEGRWVDRYAWFTDVSSSWPYTALYAPPVIPTPTPTPTNYPYIYTALGNYYAHVSNFGVAASEPLPWPNSFVYFPVFHRN